MFNHCKKRIEERRIKTELLTSKYMFYLRSHIKPPYSMHPKQIDIKSLFALHQEKEKFLDVRPARKQFLLTKSTPETKGIPSTIL